jgi:peptidoglycan/LPS O-acetylase OafA/YrhL
MIAAGILPVVFGAETSYMFFSVLAGFLMRWNESEGDLPKFWAITGVASYIPFTLLYMYAAWRDGDGTLYWIAAPVFLLALIGLVFVWRYQMKKGRDIVAPTGG